ncbi:hypothetical protein Hanom_Chr09g00763651 [Helianthus anomalus]
MHKLNTCHNHKFLRITTINQVKIHWKSCYWPTLGFKKLRFLRSSLTLAGYGEASIQYIGGLSVLISFSDRERINRLLQDKEA